MKHPQTFNVRHFSAHENGCNMNYSELSNFFHPNPYRSFSIKYVAEGSELYVANGANYNVNSGEYLLANNQTEGSILVKENQYAKGICIDLSNDLISEVLAQGEHQDIQQEFMISNFFNSSGFVENKYHVSFTELGKKLHQLHSLIQLNKEDEIQFHNDFYFEIMDALIVDYAPVYTQLQRIHSKKTETKKDLWRKSNEAKNRLDECFLKPTTIREIALSVGLSEYYFFRLFKLIYQISPYQYILNKRLNYAIELLRKTDMNIAEIAEASVLGDLSNFSKLIKKTYGISPSAMRSSF